MNSRIGIVEAAAEIANCRLIEWFEENTQGPVEHLIFRDVQEDGFRPYTTVAQDKFIEYYEEYYNTLLDKSMSSEIKFKLDEGVEMPKLESEGAVGFDIRVNSILKVFKGSKEVEAERLEIMKESFKERGYIQMREFERILFGSGIYVELSPDLELQIRSRSGIVLKRGLVVANQPGTVDPDYRGEVAVMLLNTSNNLAKVELNERVAQGVPKHIVRPVFTQVEELSKTERGEGGFGHTGTK